MRKKDEKRAEAFRKAFVNIEGNKVIYDLDFLKQFPTRKEQAERWILKMLSEVLRTEKERDNNGNKKA